MTCMPVAAAIETCPNGTSGTNCSCNSHLIYTAVLYEQIKMKAVKVRHQVLWIFSAELSSNSERDFTPVKKPCR